MSPGRIRLARRLAAKDLLIERRSRVLVNQVLPFSGLVMVVFAFALGTGGVLERAAPGLVWLAVLFSSLSTVQRSFGLETADGAMESLRVAGVDPIALFLGKAAALAIELLVLLTVLLGLAVVLYGTEPRAEGVVLLVTTAISATLGLAALGTIYGGLAAGGSGRETLLPLLVLPVAAPVLIGATRGVEAALGTDRTAVSEGWPWVGLLLVFAVAIGVGGALAFGTLIED
ncbi:MAG: heme exporter protein CcmB [Ilumatobacteraceae bacterium]